MREGRLPLFPPAASAGRNGNSRAELRSPGLGGSFAWLELQHASAGLFPKHLFARGDKDVLGKDMEVKHAHYILKLPPSCL